MTSHQNADLCAFLDQECGASERRRIDAELGELPPLAERVAAWRRNDAALRTALLADAKPEPGPGRRHPAERLLRRIAEHQPSTGPIAKRDAAAAPPYGGMALIAFGGGCFSFLLAASVMVFAVQ